MSLDTILLVAALAAFVLAAINVQSPVNLVALGLALVTASLLF